MPEWIAQIVIEEPTPLLTEPVILAVIGFAGVVVTAWMTYLGVKARADREQQSSDRLRLAQLEDRIESTERQNVGLWAYCRALIDHIYKGGGAPPPDPPNNIKSLFD